MTDPSKCVPPDRDEERLPRWVVYCLLAFGFAVMLALWMHDADAARLRERIFACGDADTPRDMDGCPIYGTWGYVEWARELCTDLVVCEEGECGLVNNVCEWDTSVPARIAVCAEINRLCEP